MDRKTLKEIEKKASQLIEKYGFFVQHVVDGPIPYSFTSGLSYAADPPLPEFAMAGFEVPLMEMFLNDAVAAMRSGDLVPDGAGYYGRHRGQEVGVVPVRPHSSPSRLLLPEEAEAYLIVMPDEAGAFPWEEGCDPTYAAQIAGFDCIELPHPRTSPPPSRGLH
ncbi:DUF4262 domain-containing protein [Pararhizobium sp. BT-229]|uniref:DUF4262 domain-containing protein n=1 Tax=Pararhizobium sp. BT-229 TaxID=2986923 RepID=UPI0021F7F883|nr:DUF4262 domain-containing protein [Pararhizobium sp. BT-229]MCV9964184.1 DUF4262 domain-containing protein [Pararhizobium sp. BT-229]